MCLSNFNFNKYLNDISQQEDAIYQQGLVNAKATRLATRTADKQQKLGNFTQDTLLGMSDADSFRTTNLGQTRNISPDGTWYDAIELQHGANPYDMYGVSKADRAAGQFGKSINSMTRQREQVAMMLGKPVATVTEQDMIDVGNQQQIQKLADITQDKGADRWMAPLIQGATQTNLTGRYQDEAGNRLNVPLDISIGSRFQKDIGSRKGADFVNPATGINVTQAAALDPLQNTTPTYNPQQPLTAASFTPVQTTIVEDAKDQSIWDDIKNIPKAFTKSFITSAVAIPDDVVDIVAGGASRIADTTGEDKASKWITDNIDIVTADEMKKSLNEHIGRDSAYTTYHTKVANKYASEALKDVNFAKPSTYLDIDGKKAWKAVKEFGHVAPTMAASSVGYMIPFIMSGEFIVKGLKLLTGSEKLMKATSKLQAVTKAEKKGILVGEDLVKAKEATSLAISKLPRIDKTKLFLARNSGAILMGTSMQGDSNDKFLKKYGEKNTIGMTLFGAAANSVGAKFDIAVFGNIVKGKTGSGLVDAFTETIKGMGKSKASKLVANMASETLKAVPLIGEEVAQETYQNVVQAFTDVYGGTKKDGTKYSLKDFAESKELKEAVGQSLFATPSNVGAMRIGAKGAEVLSSVVTPKKLIADAEDVKASKGTDTTPKGEEGVEDIVEASDDEVTQARTVFRKVRDKIKHKQIIGDNDVDDMIYAEEVVNRYKEGPDKVKAVAAVKDLKLAMVENLSETDLDKTPIIFGANKGSAEGFDKDARAIKAGHYIATILETTDYKPDVSLEEQLIKVAEANGITKKQYTETKNALAVEVEATDSSSGYNTYGTVLHRMLNLPTTDKAGATKLVNKLTGFKSSQVKFAKVVQTELDRVSKIVNTYNTNNLAEKPVKQYVVKIPQKKGDSTWKINVKQDDSGKYYVEKATQGIIDTKLKNVKDMTAILARNAKNIKDKLGVDLGTKGIPTSIYINPTLDATAGKTTKSRLAANTYYAKIGVNKVITTEDSKWKQPAFSEENEGSINPGKYSKEDIVVVSVPNSLDNKAFKEMLGKKSSEVSKQINAAIKAGATVVFDTDLHGEHFKELATQLVKYKGYSNDKASGGNVFKPKDDVATSNIKVDKDKAEATKTANTRREAIIKAVDDLHNGKEYTNDTIKKIIKDSYKGNTANFEKTLASSFNKAVKQAVKALNTVTELEDVAGTVKTDALLKAEKVIKGFSDTIMKEAKKEVADSEVSVGEYSDMLTKYNEAIAEGKTEEAEAILNGLEDNDIVNYVLDNSQSKGLPSVYRYTYVDTKGKQSTRVALTKESLAKNKQEDSVVTIQEIDINKIVVKGSPTFLNSVAASMMGKTVSKYTNAFIGLLKQALASDTVKGKTKATLHSLGLATDPARALMYSVDPVTGKEVINENVALALQLATDEFIAFNSRMLSTGYKSDADIASMLGIDEGKVTAKLRKAIEGKGMFKKTLANSIGKAAMAKLGLSRAKDIEEETFDKLAADLGNMGVMAMLKSGDTSADTTMTSSELGHLMGVKSNSKKPVTFIHFTSEDAEVVHAYITSRRTLFEDVHENVQEELAFRREPSTRPIKGSKYANKVAKTKAGFTTSDDVESVMEDLRAIEWNVDFEVLDRVMKDEESLKSWLGYTEDTAGMSFYDAEGQVSKNRDILKSIEELRLIKESGNQKLFFDWFYSSNGRYMMEANTLNPQTDKLHRFIIQPSSHISELKVTKDNGVTKNGKDVTDEFDYAIAQAFGFAVDKKNSTKVAAVGEALRTDKKLLTKATKAIKNNEKFEIGDVEMEPEHIAHAYQAIVALEKLHKGGTFSTSITAETDAVTSGFALKLMQMPILGDTFEDMFKWLNKVGLFRAGDLRGSSMNDILDGKEFTDSYQTLAKNVKVKAKTVAENIDPKSRVRYVEGTWEKLSKVLPQFNEAMDEVSPELRALFKDPFMTFNYSAGMKSIRESLTGVLTNKVVTKMINASKGDSAYELLSVLAKDMSMSPSALQAEMTTSPLYLIKGDSGVSIADVLSEYINAGYGTTVEDIMTGEFSEFVDAQKQINNAFRAMFAMFNKEYKEGIAEVVKAKGFITATDKIEVIDKLRDKFPAIKGPMSTKEDKSDYIGIYRTKNASPGSDGTRLPAAQTSLKEGEDTKTNTIAHEIKVFEEAISSGSVVPIHYIDGALMGKLLKKTGAVFTAIHDAIMMPLGEINNGAREYNKLYHDVSTEYSFIQEIVNQLGTMPDLSDKYYDQKKGKESLRTFIKSSYKGMEELNTKVQAGRKAIKAELDKGSAYMHMAALKDGVHYHNMVAPEVSEWVQKDGVKEAPAGAEKLNATKPGDSLNETPLTAEQLVSIKEANDVYRDKYPDMFSEGKEFRYYPDTNKITVVKPTTDNGITKEMYEVYTAHEIRHAITYKYLNSPKGAKDIVFINNAIRKAYKELEPGRDMGLHILMDRLKYAVEEQANDVNTAAEVVAILSAEPSVREAFLSVFPQKTKSRLEKILDAIKKFIGMEVEQDLVPLIDSIVKAGKIVKSSGKSLGAYTQLGGRFKGAEDTYKRMYMNGKGNKDNASKGTQMDADEGISGGLASELNALKIRALNGNSGKGPIVKVLRGFKDSIEVMYPKAKKSIKMPLAKFNIGEKEYSRMYEKYNSLGASAFEGLSTEEIVALKTVHKAVSQGSFDAAKNKGNKGIMPPIGVLAHARAIITNANKCKK